MVIGKTKTTPLEYFRGLKANQVIDWYESQLCKVYDGGYDVNLLEDEDVIEKLNDDLSFFQAAAELRDTDRY